MLLGPLPFGVGGEAAAKNLSPLLLYWGALQGKGLRHDGESRGATADHFRFGVGGFRFRIGGEFFSARSEDGEAETLILTNLCAVWLHSWRQYEWNHNEKFKNTSKQSTRYSTYETIQRI